MKPGTKVWTLVDDPQGLGRGFVLEEWRVMQETAAGYVLRVPVWHKWGDGGPTPTGPEIKYFPRSMVLNAKQAKEYKQEAEEADPKQGDLVLVIEQYKHKPLQGIVVSTTKAMADVLMTDGSTGPAWKERRQDGNPFRRCSKRTLVVISRGDVETKAETRAA